MYLFNEAKMGLRRFTKALLSYAVYKSGLLDQLAKYRTGIKNEHRIIILGYHRVVKDFSSSSALSIPSMLISASTFLCHVNLICQRFDCISLDEALDVIAGYRTLKRDAVVITFDDGYQDFYDVAYPILHKYKLPATIFVPTSMIGGKTPLTHDQLYYLILEMARYNHSIPKLLKEINLLEPLLKVSNDLCDEKTNHYSVMRSFLELPQKEIEKLIKAMKDELKFSDSEFPTEYQLLTWPKLLEMADAGITIGAHTRRHTLLTQEAKNIAEAEIRGSKAELELNLGRTVHHFAYPDGRYNHQIAELVRNAGFQSACTVEDRPNIVLDNPYQLKRKLLWERSCLGIFSGFSEIVAECQLRGLFANSINKQQSGLVNSYE